MHTPKMNSARRKRLDPIHTNPPPSSRADYKFENSQIAISKICVDALKAGCLDAFKHVFHLSHRPPVLVDPIAERYFSVTTAKLKDISDALVKAEEIKRQSDKVEEVYSIYHNLAGYFEQCGDVETAAYFHRKGQEAARFSSNPYLEGRAHRNHGQMYERVGDMDSAMKHYEAQATLAQIHEGPDLEDALKNVVRVCVKRAEELEQTTENMQEARELFEKAYSLACKTDDKKLIADTAHRCGCVLTKLGEMDRALEFHQTHHDMSADQMELKEKVKAMSQLGSLYEKVGMKERALGLMQELLDTAAAQAEQSSSDPEAKRMIGEAHEKLGTLLLDMGRCTEAVDHLEKNYKLACEAQDEKWSLAARIRLGHARGELALRAKMGKDGSGDGQQS